MAKFKSFEELQKSLNKDVKLVIEEGVKALAKEVPDKVLEQISKGISPVDGEGRFAEYSDSYKDQIKNKTLDYPKKPRPVNLKLSGEMLKSLKATTDKDSVTISITDEKATYHNDLGAGASKTKRRILPSEQGEKFNRVIQTLIKNIFNKTVNKYLK